MPAVTSGLVVVTGASGFIGTHTIKALLDAGYAVRAIVRSESKGEHVKSLFPGAGDALTTALVPDMVAAGAYDHVLTGADAVVHTASPMPAEGGDPAEMIAEAVAGVKAVTGPLPPSVKRVVQLSSVVAADMGDKPKHVTEEMWNDEAVEQAERLGKATPPFVQYDASKVEAERAFWSEMKGKSGVDGVAILPGVVLGPATQYGTGIVGSVGFMLPWLRPGASEVSLAQGWFNLADVREVAASIVAALKVPEAGGRRFFVAGEPVHGNDFALAAEAFPQLADKGLTKGIRDASYRQKLIDDSVNFDSTAAESMLGVQFRKKEVTLHDTIAAIVDRL